MTTISPGESVGTRHVSTQSSNRAALMIQERLIANCGERFAVSVLWRFFDRHEIT